MAGVPVNSTPSLTRHDPKPVDVTARPKGRVYAYRPDLQYSTHERRRVALGDANTATVEQNPLPAVRNLGGPTGSGGGGTGGRR